MPIVVPASFPRLGQSGGAPSSAHTATIELDIHELERAVAEAMPTPPPLPRAPTRLS
jgi:hypothetical protein